MDCGVLKTIPEALTAALFPGDRSGDPLAVLRPMLLICLLLAPFDLYDLSLLVEFEADILLGEFGFEVATAILSPWLATLSMMLMGVLAGAVAVPDRLPVWRVAFLRPHHPDLHARVPI
jgi:hypothetical protein